MSGSRVDRFAGARALAAAVLYEGYVLYPYRASSSKNRMRWQFGMLVPPGCRVHDPSERSSVQVECVVEPGESPRLAVRVSCLQVQCRTVERALDPAGTAFAPCDALDAGGTTWVEWDEAVQHDVDLPELPLFPVAEARLELPFTLPAGEDVEIARDGSAAVVGRIVRRREEVRGQVFASVAWVDDPELAMKVTLTVENATDWARPETARDEVARHSLVALHAVLAIDDGAFVSLLDPADRHRAAVDACVNDGLYPVLVGEPGSADTLLASPIILYDHPLIAPESQGDLYDATEIDEILALRVLTLTDDEKREARATDPRAAAIIDRCDAMEPDAWERLHGAVRSLESLGLAGPPAGSGGPEGSGAPDEGAGPDGPNAVPWWDPGVDGAVDPSTDTVWIRDRLVGKGTAVRLRPSRRADAHDLFLAGRTAKVAGVFRDVDGNDHVAVTLDDDPAAAELEWQGRYLYFAPDELEPLLPAGARVLVAGIGNIFLGDDGFGVEVAGRLRGTPMPDGVRVEDFGIRGVHLAYELLDGYDALVLVDAVPMSEPPGTVAVIEVGPDMLPEPGDDSVPIMDAHSMSPVTVLNLLAGLGGRVGRILVIGCEPETVEEGIGLSAVVAAAVEPAVAAVREVVDDLVAELAPVGAPAGADREVSDTTSSLEREASP